MLDLLQSGVLRGTPRVQFLTEQAQAVASLIQRCQEFVARRLQVAYTFLLAKQREHHRAEQHDCQYL